MTIKLISLVVITLFLLSGHSYSEEQFLFPKKKPSIFKNIKNSNKIDLSKNLPQKKPFINKEQDIEKDKEVKKKEVAEKKEVEKTVTFTTKSSFIYPQKKTCYL